MAATQLDSRTALIVVDLQKIVVSMPTVHPLAANADGDDLAQHRPAS